MTPETTRRVLTGITTTGSPHLGNYAGMLRPAIASSRRPNTESYFFLADYHALVKCDDPERVRRSTLEIAATWLACGLDPESVYFYRQSDIPEIPELMWLLTCVTGKGLLNRAHAYKAAVDANAENGGDPDAGITAGLYMYPVLMAADILAFNAHEVPVGRDQVQHIEMARDIGQRFNHLYGGEYFTLPEARIDENTAVLPGLDGRKMSKSYNNTIPLWVSPNELRKLIAGIKTDSRAPGEPKNPDESHLYTLFQAFASPADTKAYGDALRAGMAWGDAKQALFERIDAELAPMRARYATLIAEPDRIESTLRAGAEKARVKSQALLAQVRHAAGLRSLGSTCASTVAAPKAKREAAGRFVQFKEKDGSFRFKLAGADGAVLLESIGFATAKEVGLTIAELKLGDRSNLDERGNDRARTLELAGTPLGTLHVPLDVVCDTLASMREAG